MTSKAPIDYTAEELHTRLTSEGLGQVADRLRGEDMDGATALEMTEATMKELKLSIGTRHRLGKVLEKMRRETEQITGHPVFPSASAASAASSSTPGGAAASASVEMVSTAPKDPAQAVADAAQLEEDIERAAEGAANTSNSTLLRFIFKLCVRFCCKAWLAIVNVAFLIAGIALFSFGVSARAITTDTVEDVGTELVQMDGINTVIATGVLIIIVAIMGCLSALKDGRGVWRCVLFVYVLLLAVIVLLQFIAAGLLFSWMGQLTTVRNSAAGATLGAGERAIDQSLNRTFISCCIRSVNGTACRWLSDVVDLRCGSFDEFKREIIDDLEDKVEPLAEGLILLAVAEILGIAFACYLCCTRPATREAKQEEVMEEPQAGDAEAPGDAPVQA